MHSLKVGHHTNEKKGTGVTVFLFEPHAKGAYLVCGSSPASHELMTLNLDSNVSYIDGLVFTGGSAYGLSSVQGVMRWCKEHDRGHRTTAGVVPIIPTVGIYDLTIHSSNPPTEDEAYLAAQSARIDNRAVGRIGAGTGATIGKMVPHAARMTGGIGRAELRLPDGLEVVAYAVVNSLGDVRDKAGSIIAGARLPDGTFADCEAYLLAGNDRKASTSNSTLVAVFTNAHFSKIELSRIAKVAMSGMARAISPVFTRYDGDILFCISVGEHIASENVVSVLAAEAVRLAIVNAVKDSIVLEA